MGINDNLDQMNKQDLKRRCKALQNLADVRSDINRHLEQRIRDIEQRIGLGIVGASTMIIFALAILVAVLLR